MSDGDSNTRTSARTAGESSRDSFAALYDELHRLAEQSLRRTSGVGSLSPTSVLHEAYLDLSSRESVFPDRSHFMAYAARAMRAIIVDFARRHRAQKRGGRFEITSLPTEVPEHRADQSELTRVADSMEELAAVDPRLAEVVDLKYFCGFSFAEIAAMRNVSERTVQRDWDKARLLLHRALKNTEDTN